jgi:hypothetical protein
VEDFPVHGRGGGIGQDRVRHGGDDLVDEERLGAVDQEEGRDPSGGEVAEKGLGLQA